MPFESFFRALRFSQRARGTPLAFSFIGVLSALPVVPLLVVLGLIVELLATGGDSEVPTAVHDEVASWIDVKPNRVLPDGVVYFDHGLLPIVIRLKDGPLGPPARKLYLAIPALQSNLTCLLLLVAMGVALVAVQSLLSFVLERSVRQTAERAASRLRWAVHRQALQLTASDVLGGSAADPVKMFGENTDAVRGGLTAWWCAVPRAIVVCALLFGMALWIHPSLALAVMLLACGLAILFYWLARRARQRLALLGDRASHQMALLAESLRAVRLARGLLLDDMPGVAFDEALERQRRTALARDTSDAALLPIAQFAVAGAAAVALFLVGVNVLGPGMRMTLGEAVILISGLACALAPLRQLVRLSATLERANRAARAIFVYLDRRPLVGQVADAIVLAPMTDRLCVERVTLVNRSGHKLLDDVTMTIPAGRHVAVMASSRRVQTALAGLLSRFFDPETGRITVDGVDVRQLTLESVRRQVMVVFQTDLLFTASVTDNLRCGDDGVSAEQIAQATKQSEVYDRVRRLPDGFDTIVGTHGTRLEPHEAARIGLARVLLRDPSLVILEEPNDLDPHSAETWQLAVTRAAEGRTLIVFPSRLGTVRAAETVFVFDDAKLRAEGTHSQLLQESDLYRHLHYLRFNEFARRGRSPGE